MRYKDNIEKKISLIVVAYDRYTLLLESIRSVLIQSNSQDIEIIVVDNGSTEEIKDIISLRKDIIYKRISKCTIAKARNIGISLANCKYISFLDSDDVLLKNKLLHQIHFMEENNLDICYTNYHLYSDSNVYCYPFNKLSAEFWKHFFPYGTTSFMVKSESLTRTSLFDTTLVVGEDWDFFAQAKQNKLRVGNLPQPLYLYRIHDDNISFKTNINHKLYTLFIQIKNKLSVSDSSGNYGGWKRPLNEAYNTIPNDELQRIRKYVQALQG